MISRQASAFKTVLLGAFVVVMFASVAAIVSGVKLFPVRDAPFRCSVRVLSGNAETPEVARACGVPYSINIDTYGNEQWVYDAGTFLWFHEGHFASYKLDDRHKAEQEKLPHTRGPVHLHY